MEQDARYYRRRASEEMAAANRAVTEAARQRRMTLAGIFLDRLKALEASPEIAPAPRKRPAGKPRRPAFDWSVSNTLEQV